MAISLLAPSVTFTLSAYAGYAFGMQHIRNYCQREIKYLFSATVCMNYVM
jgi:hypothetical protein